MAPKSLFLLILVCLAFTNISAINRFDNKSVSLNRHSFPVGFTFGTASAAYQYEGAVNEGGRGPSIWDTYTHKHAERIKDRSNGDVAVDSYHRYKEDVGIMKGMNLDAYRFSISWSRLLPNGKLSGGVNREGINYYNNLIDELLANGIKPFVTLFHWDLPQALEDEYGGFLSPHIVNDFRDYADLCFREFGDRVKNWITLNEPVSFCTNGYVEGTMAPGRCSSWLNRKCLGGNSGTEPYLAAHYQLLSHAAAVRQYKDKYQASQKGKIGITLLSSWTIPIDNKKKHQEAAKRNIDFMFGWYMSPIANGDYPQSMRSLVGNRLPKFTEQESELLKGSYDFLGLNYYTSNYAADIPYLANAGRESYRTDSRVNLTSERNGVLIGPRGASDWIFVYPRGIYDLLHYTKNKYNVSLIYITENGIDEVNDPNIPLEEALNDKHRVDYYYHHLSYVKKAIKEGVNVEGYFAWSLLDNFEWNIGYTVRFGINYVDYKNGLTRHHKLSARWFTNFLRK